MLLFGTLISNAQCITTQPINASTCQGPNQQAIFTVGATGATAFNWQLLNNTTNTWSDIANGSNYSGATSASLTVTGLNTNPAVYSYRCNVSNVTGPCETSDVVTLTVKPRPVVSALANPLEVCSGNALSIVLTNSLGASGASFSWSRASLSGITPSTVNGTASTIAETLMNSTNAGISVSYSASTTTNGCTSNSTSVSVTIKPRPNIADVTTPIQICSGESFNSTLNYPAGSIVPSGTNFTWTVANSINVTGETSNVTTPSAFSQSALSHTTAVLQSLNYELTPIASGCAAPASFAVTIEVKPRPNISNFTTPIQICSGESFNSNLSYPAGSIVPSGTNFTWTVSNSAAVAGETSNATNASAFSQGVLSHSSASVQSLNYSVTPIASSCPGTTPFTVAIQVKPRPNIANITTPIQVCSGDSYTSNFSNESNAIIPVGTLYTWTVVTSSIINGESSNNVSVASFSSGVLNHTQNTTPAALNYSLTANADGCTSVFTLSIQVKPTPAIATKSISICSNNLANISPTNGNGDIVPAGTVYSWISPVSTSLTGMTSGNSQSAFGQTLLNTSGADQNISYSVIPNAAGCLGASFMVNAQIKFEPTPNVSGPQSICQGEDVQLFVDGGASYVWTPNSNISAWFISNPNVSPSVTTTYNVTVTGGNGCSTNRSVIVTVNANPNVTNLASAASSVCSGGTFSFNPTVTSGAGYQWSRENNGAYSANPSFGFGAISNVLFNELSGATAVAYHFTVTSNTTGCSSDQTLNVSVHPLPSISNSADFANSICSNQSISFSLLSSLSSNYLWTRTQGSAVTSTNPTTGNSAISNHSFINSSNTEQWVEYNFTLTSTNGACQATESLGLWVQPNIVLNNNSTVTASAICSGTALNYFPNVSNGLNGVTLFWSRNTLPSGLFGSGNGNGQGNLTDVLYNSANTSLTAGYNLTGYYNGCSSNAVLVNIPILPIPSVIQPINNSVCSGAALSTSLSSSVSGTNIYTWSAVPASGSSLVGNGSLSGTTNSISHTWSNVTNENVIIQYSAEVSNGGCVSELVFWTVSVKPIPELLNTPVQASKCSGDTWTFDPQWSTSITTYSWSRSSPSPMTGTSIIQDLLVNNSNAPISASYTMQGTSAGCSSSSIPFTLIINPLPSVNSDTLFQFCSDDIANVSIPNWTDENVAWTPAAVFQNPFSHETLYIGVNSIDAQASAINQYGCARTSIVSIQIADPIDASFNAVGTACTGDLMVLSVQNIGSGLYSWIVDGEMIAEGSSYALNPVQNFEVVLLVEQAGCSNQSTQEIEIHNLPINEIIGSEEHCQNQNAVVFQCNNSDVALHWELENGSLLGGQGSNEIYVQLGLGSNAEIRLESTDAFGCISSDTLFVTLGGLADSAVVLNVIGQATLVHPDSTIGQFRWGKTNIATGIEESVLSGYQYFNFGFLDLTQYYYWVESSTDEGCSTRSYFNEPSYPIDVLNFPDQNFDVYPNPTENGLIYFKGIENFDARIFNSTGCLVYQVQVANVLDLSSFDSGLYYVVLSHSNQLQTIKVIRL